MNRWISIGVLCVTMTVPVMVNAQEYQQHVFNIYFNTGVDEVSAASMNQIRQNLMEIGPVNIREIRLRGHADSDAEDSFNIRLSERRAANTYQFLIQQGVPESLITKEFYGEGNPVSDNKALNRRVEITLVYDYSSISTAFRNKRFTIKGKVTNFNTGNPLACTFVIEDKNLNVFKSTRSDGMFIIPGRPGNDVKLTFSRDGFLNTTQALTDQMFRSATGDTLYLNIRLKPVEVFEKIVFERIFFFSDSDSLRPESKPDLDKLTEMLRSDKNLYIEIQGHMNCPLSRPMTVYQKRYNQELSFRRARTIYRYLVKMGIPPSQLTYKGLSNQFMIYPEPRNEQEADKNKRVEVWKLRVVK